MSCVYISKGFINSGISPVTCITYCRCLELRPNNLPALMALAVSFTNSGLQQEACNALHRWILHNTRYKHLVQGNRTSLQGSPATPRKDPHTCRYEHATP